MYKEAKENYEKVLKLDPERPKVHVLLGNIAYHEGEVEEGIKHYRKAIEMDQKYTIAYFNLAIALEEKGEISNAIRNYEKVIEIDPNHAEAYSNLGSLLKEKGDIEGAIKNFKKAVEIDESLTAPKKKLEEILEEVQEQVRAKEVVRRAEEFLKDGDVFEEKGDLEKAIESYEKSVRAYPSLIGHFLLGLALEKRGDLGGAAENYKAVLRMDPRIAVKDVSSEMLEIVGKRIGNTRFTGAELVRIFENFRKHVVKKPKKISMMDYIRKELLRSPEEYIKMGSDYEAKGEADKAVKYYKKAVEVAPFLPIPYYILGLALEQKGEVEEARLNYQKALELDIGFLSPRASKELSDTLSKQLGNIYVRSMDPVKVLREFKEYVEEGKGELSLGNFIRLKITGKAEERIRRGYLLDVRGTVEEAISAYEKAIEIDPHNLVAHYILGLALESKGEFEKAMERYEKSEEVDLAKAPRKVSREIIDILNNYLGRTTKDGHKVGTILKRYIEIIGENPEKMARLLSYIEDIKLDAIANIISSYLRDEALIEAGGKIIRDEEDFAEDYEERMKLKKAKEISKEEVNLIWKYKTGRTIRCLAVSKAGGDIVGGSENGKIYFLDKHGNPVWKADAKVSIVDIDISPEGGYVVEGLYDGNVELRDSEGKMVWKADFKESGVSSVAVSEGAEYTIVATRDYQLILLNRAGEILWKHPIKGYCTRVDISSDGRNIVACSDTGELYFIKNTKEMLPIVDALKIKDTLYSVSISPDGRFYAAGSKQGKVYFMDENKRILWKREVLSHVYGVAVSENGRYVSAGTSSGLVYYFTKGGKQKWKYPTGINVWDVGISGDGEEVVAGCGLVFGNIYLFSAI